MEQLLTELEKFNCDVEGGLKRLVNNEKMYLKYLCRFPNETTLLNFAEALKHKDYECAYNEIHTFKGVTGNLGLTELYELSKEIMQLLKEQEYEKADVYAKELFAKYKQIINIISLKNVNG